MAPFLIKSGRGQFFSFFFCEFFVFLRNGDGHGNGYDHDCCGSTTTAITTLTMVTIAATWWLRPRLRQLGGYDHGNGYDHDCCGSTAAWWLRPRQRLRKRLLRLNGGLVATTTATATTTTAAAQRRLGGYDQGNGYDHDCCGSTANAITTLAILTIAVAMSTVAG